ncbi:MAG TPA: hypothetical protein ENF34_04930 [Candidatus Bathyarchaeota archaeon]|nr:MAG: hypothetical protein DRO60_01600 [Candidatus Bathyarchaeota archaeon]HDJ26641.1 hypothetical protein [Candidatus Bathyarchaeota archaeon]
MRLPEEVVLREGVRLFLENELRNVKAEMAKICSKHGVNSSEELWRKIEAGELTESECLDDLMRLEHLEARLEDILELLRGYK